MPAAGGLATEHTHVSHLSKWRDVLGGAYGGSGRFGHRRIMCSTYTEFALPEGWSFADYNRRSPVAL